MSDRSRPVDTSKIDLPESIRPLIELLAEHNHAVWVERRLAEGWSWGAEREDTAKKHPDLVRYTELLESEKEYDRQTAIEVLKAIVALGYRIEKRGEP